MKLIRQTLLCALFALISLNSIAQNDTIKITNSIDSNLTQYLTPMEYAFMFHEDTPWMFKAGIISSVRQDYSFLGFEKRIKGSMTINLSLGLEGILNDLNYSVSVAPRYYYDMNRRNKERNTPFNFSGNYLEGGYTYYNFNNFYRIPENEGARISDFQSSNHIFNIKWGLQRRYLKRGFIDLNLNASFTTGSLNVNSFQVNSESKIGFAFARDRSNLDKSKLCSFIKCYESEKSVFKINTTRILSTYFDKQLSSISFSPEIAYEIKLGSSAFSINNNLITEISGNYIKSSVNNFLDIPSGIGVSIQHLLEGRYYFNLKKRILKGKTGNGLSADYLSAGLFSYYLNDDQTYNFTSLYSEKDFYFLQPQITIGTQRFIGDHFFYDIGFGFRFNSLVDRETPYGRSSYEFILHNRIGFRF